MLKLWVMKEKRLVNFRYFFYPFLMFLFAIIMSKGLFSGEIENICIVVIVLALLIGFCIYKKCYKIMTLLLVTYILGTGFFFIGVITSKVRSYDGVVSVVARVSDDFEESDYYYTVVLDDVKINGQDSKNIEATFSKGQNKLKIGDRVSFESEVTALPVFSLGGLNSSIYRSGIGYSVSLSTSDLVVTDGYTTFDEDVRQSIKSLLYENMSEDNASIAYAVLFGDQNGISFETQSAYRDSGIIHIITVSGFNVAFLIAIIYSFLNKCRVNKKISFLVTTIVIVLYAYFCSFAPSVLRASVMGIVIMLSNVIGRRYDALNALGLSGIIILVFSPLTAFDVGFLMSVACVCGIVFLSPMFTNLLKKFIPNKIAQYIAVSLSAQLAILPFLASFSSTLNLLNAIVNLFVVPIFALIFPYLFVVSFIILLLPPLSFLLVPIEWGLVACKAIATIFASTTFQVKLSPWNITTSALYFVTIFLISTFFMVAGLVKFEISSAFIFFIVSSIGLFTLTGKLKSGVLYLYSYRQQSVVMASSGGQTLAVGDCYITDRALAKYRLDGIDYYLSFESLDDRDIERLKEFDIEYYVCLGGDEFQEGLSIVTTNTMMQAGDFTFVYIETSEGVLGVTVQFDGLSIFVASGLDFDYNYSTANAIIASFDTDIAFTDQNFQLASPNYMSVSSVRNGLTDYNYVDNGNLLVTKNDALKVNFID